MKLSLEVLSASWTVAGNAAAASSGAPADSEVMKICGSGTGGSGGVGGAPLVASGGAAEEEASSALTFMRVLTNMAEEVARAEARLIRSHHCRRVEWRIEHASTLRACFPEGRCLCSTPFAAAGLDGLSLVLFPSGHRSAKPGYCSFFVTLPSNASASKLTATLKVGRQRFLATPTPEQGEGFMGRINAAIFETAVDAGDDSLLLSLEVGEAKDEVLKVGSKQDAWRNSLNPLSMFGNGRIHSSAKSGGTTTPSGRLRALVSKTQSPPKDKAELEADAKAPSEAPETSAQQVEPETPAA